jgi:hypothetical protein
VSGESNDWYGELAEHQTELANAFDGYERLPDAGQDDVLDAFVAAKGITIESLVKQGTRKSAPTVLATPYPDGIRYRDMESGQRWSAPESKFNRCKIIRAGIEPSDTVILSESETDGAALCDRYSDCDIALPGAGAKRFTKAMAAQLTTYARVYVAYDDDAAGEAGWQKVKAAVSHAVRHAPPAGCKDWCEYDGDTVPPLPEALPPAGPGLRTRGVDMSRVVRTEWAWQGYIPKGYISLLIGDEGIGKGTLMAWLIARATRGELDGDSHGIAQRVLIVGDEDAFEPVWVPRASAAGADLDLIHTLDDGEFLDDFALQADALVAAIERDGYGLVIFDQLLDHIDGGKDGAGIYNAKHVRQALKPMRRVARSTNVAVLGLLHPPKGKSGDFRSLVSGSHQFNALSRSSLLLVSDPEDETRRVLVRGKGNLSATPEAVEFAIASAQVELNDQDFNVPKVVDVCESGRTVKDLIGRPKSGEDKNAQHVEALVAALRANGEPMRRKELATALDMKDNGTFKVALKHAKDAGLIYQAKSHGPYALPDDPKDPPI